MGSNTVYIIVVCTRSTKLHNTKFIHNWLSPQCLPMFLSYDCYCPMGMYFFQLHLLYLYMQTDVNASEDQRIVHLKEQFACLLNEVLNILQYEEYTNVYQVQVLVQQLPISCSDPQRVLEPQERLEIQKAKCIPQIFSILSGKYISYENFSLLESIARTFCNRRAKPLLDAYTKEYHNPDSTGHPPLQQV